MKMFARNFNSTREAVDFVNKSGIAQENVVSLTPSADGTYLLVYYAED